MMDLIVKVGSKALLKFNTNSIYRAITVAELAEVTKSESIKFVIIEDIYPEEREELHNFVSEYLKDTDNYIAFYAPDEVNNATGIADEFECDIFMSCEPLYETILKKTGTYVGNNLNKIKELKEHELEELNSEFASLECLTEQETTEETKKESEQEENQSKAVKEDNNSNYNIDITDTAEYKKQEAELERVRNLYNELLTDMKVVTSNFKELEKLNKYLKDEAKDIKDRFNAIISNEEVQEQPIPLSEYEELKNSVEEKDSKIKSLAEHIDDMKEKIERLKNSIDNKDKQLDEKEEELDRSKAQVKELSDKVEDLNKTIYEKEQTEKGLFRTIETLSIQSNRYENVDEEINSYKSKIGELEDKLIELQNNAITLSDKSIDSDSEELKSALNEIKELKSKIDDKDKLIEELNKKSENTENNNVESDKLKERIEELENINSSTEDELREAENKNKDMLEKISELENKVEQLNRDNIQIRNDSLEDKNNLLESQDRLRDANRKCNEDIERLEKQLGLANQKLKETKVASMKDIQYNGNAEIITVFGSGSFGITTTAVSLATKLAISGAKVLFIDFDLTKPKSDLFFEEAPTISGGRTVNETALALMLENDINYLRNNVGALIKACQIGRFRAQIGYMGGIYYNIDENKVLGYDYYSMLNMLGQIYEYIVIDFGKIRSSRITDNLISKFSKIASSNIAVTLKQDVEIRNILMAFDTVGIRQSDITLLLNMCENMIMGNNIQGKLINMKYSQMMISREMYGSHDIFSANKDTRDLFNNFIDQYILNEKR